VTSAGPTCASAGSATAATCSRAASSAERGGQLTFRRGDTEVERLGPNAWLLDGELIASSDRGADPDAGCLANGKSKLEHRPCGMPPFADVCLSSRGPCRAIPQGAASALGRIRPAPERLPALWRVVRRSGVQSAAFEIATLLASMRESRWPQVRITFEGKEARDR
jgi:hypothetical protein